MKSSNEKRNVNAALLIGAALFLALNMALAIAAPGGPSIISNSTDNGPVKPGTQLNTSGGTITTIVLYGLTQDLRWKAYIGNVSGRLALQDASNYTIYDWSISSVSGEVYASRSSSVDWSRISCATPTNISNEETALNITASNDDSLSRTFATQKHRSFYVGSTRISNSTCYSVATYVNNQSQTINENSYFQEVLLSDYSNMVYSSLLENKTAGYNTQRFDFQMIVPDYGLLQSSNVLYYFYLELI